MALPAAPAPYSPKSDFWRNRSEDELLKLEFTTHEPELLDGMSNEPVIAGEAAIEFAYDLHGRPQGKAICVHCKFANHFKGFVIKLADGSRRLVGKDCGRKLYGGNFAVLEKDFDTARDLARWLRRRRALLAGSQILLAGIEGLKSERCLWQFSHMQRDIRRVFESGLAQSLRGTALRGEQLSITERVRDYAAEERRRDIDPEHTEALNRLNRVEQRRYRRRHDLPDPEVYKVVDVPIGPLRGGALFLGRASPEQICKDLTRDISNIVGILRNGSNWTILRLGKACARLVELVDELESEIAKLRAPLEFFELGHLQMIARWANHHQTGTEYRCGIGWIEKPGEYGSSIRATCPADYAPPSADFIAAFRGATE